MPSKRQLDWYELESYYMYYIPDYYYHLYAMQTSLDADQLAVLNRGLSRADHWSAYYNCSAFSEAVWNSVCADTLIGTSRVKNRAWQRSLKYGIVQQSF